MKTILTPIRVLLVDDHAVVREGLKALISNEEGMEVVGEAGDGPSAITMCEKLDPDVVVVDVSMPGMTGAQLTTKLREVNPNRKVLALTFHEDASYLRLLLEAGAAGYVLKRAASEELVRAIRAVSSGGTYLDPTLAGNVVSKFVRTQGDREKPVGELSEREVAVLRLIALGYSNKEIAAQHNLSVKTVETYKTRALEKLGLKSRVDIVQYASRVGWLKEG